MKKNIDLKITTTQESDITSSETIALTVEGTIEKMNSSYKIEYVSFIDESTKIETTIYLKNEAVFIYNKGAYGSNLTLRINKKHECNYHTPYGNLKLSIFPTEVYYNVDGNTGGEIKLSYHLSVNDKHTGFNNIKIMFKCKNE